MRATPVALAFRKATRLETFWVFAGTRRRATAGSGIAGCEPALTRACRPSGRERGWNSKAWHCDRKNNGNHLHVFSSSEKAALNWAATWCCMTSARWFEPAFGRRGQKWPTVGLACGRPLRRCKFRTVGMKS